MREIKVCTVCSSSFETIWRQSKVCSEKCRKIHIARLYGRYADTSIQSGAVGAISELIVSAELMKKGYTVFRALSPDAFCDLLIHKDGKIKRVEVTTGYQTAKGTISHPKKLETMIERDIDILAVYLRITEKVYLLEREKKFKL